MSQSGFRTEQDSMGKLQVPADALYGAQTQRAIENFPISGRSLPACFICAVAHIKRAAAHVNQDLGLLDKDIATAIQKAADQVIAGKHPDQFPVDIFQTGSGTSTNMNVNEVIAHLASTASGLNISPNDHVNMGQSSNDVIPSAIHLSAALELSNHLLPALNQLMRSIESRATELDDICKTGRTHLMDAMPIRMSQELHGWAHQIRQDHARIDACLPRLHQLAQGGTAVGSGINTPPEFAEKMARELSEATGLSLHPSPDFFASLSSQDTAVELSGQLKTLAVSLLKIANDLRWMNSGPLAGLGEIELPALQPGSSIMPGKINPVIPEAVAMASAQVIGNDSCITIAGQSGSFQLNVMLPVIADNLLQSIQLLSNASSLLTDKAISGFKVNRERIEQALARNPILVTALNPVIGYMKAAEIAKAAYEQGRPIIEVAEEMTDLGRDKLERLLEPHQLTYGGIQR